MEFRRFVSYVYEYAGEEKLQNCGFVKVEVRQEMMRLVIHLQTRKKIREKCRIYGFVRKENRLEGVFIGEAPVQNGMVDVRFLRQAQNVGESTDTPISFEQLGGIVFMMNNGGCYSTVWDEDGFSMENFQRPREQEEEPAEEKDAAADTDEREKNKEDSSMEQKNTEGDRNGGQEKLEGDGKVEQGNGERDRNREQKNEERGKNTDQENKEGDGNREQEDKDRDGNAEQEDKDRDGNAEQEDKDRDGNAKQKNEEMGSADQQQENSKKEGKTGEQERPYDERLHMQEEQEKGGISLENAGETKGGHDKSTMEKGMEMGQQKESGTMTDWDRIGSIALPMQPFAWAQDQLYYRLELKDFKYLPKKYQYLMKNSFLIHGYYNYKYFIIGQCERGMVIGIPGVYHPMEELVAAFFGFGEFWPAQSAAKQNGSFGYWRRFVY